MNKIKKRIVFAISICIFCLICISSISAASIGMSINKSSATVGDSFSVSISGINGKVSITSSSNVSLSNAGVVFVDGAMTISGKANSSGNGTVTVTPIDVTTTSAEPEVVTTPRSVSISIKEKAQPQPQVQPQQPAQNNSSSKATQNNNAVNNTTQNKSQTNNNNSSKDSNVYLSNLQVNKEGLTPNFNKYKTSYAITVGEDVGSLNVTATPEVSTSKVSVSGNTDLKNGDNKIYVTVTAENGSKRVYTITVTKTGDPVKSNSYLENLIVENATMSPEFSKEVFEYDCGTVGASVKNLKILAFGENENVKVEIIGNDELKEGENTITVKVTSEDGTTTKEYTIKVKKDSSIVEEDKTEEINALENTDNNGFKAKIKRLLDKLKNNWLLVLMYVFCLLEFFEIIYLYRRQGKKTTKTTKKDEENTDANKKRAGANKFKE